MQPAAVDACSSLIRSLTLPLSTPRCFTPVAAVASSEQDPPRDLQQQARVGADGEELPHFLRAQLHPAGGQRADQRGRAQDSR